MNFITLRIYAEALDRFCVRLNKYLVTIILLIIYLLEKKENNKSLQLFS